MSITSSLTSTGTAAAATAAATGAGKNQSISQADFLQLLVTQMTNQDPTSPMDSSQMVAQLAQISQVSATTDLQSSVDNLLTSMRGNQVSSASSLIGHTVTVPTKLATLSKGSFIGAVQVPSGGGDVQVQISDPSTGKVLRSVDLGTANEGLAGFSWNGLANDGSTLADGTYALSATVNGQSATTYTAGTVQGVGNDTSGQGNYVQVSGVGNVSLGDVAQVN